MNINNSNDPKRVQDFSLEEAAKQMQVMPDQLVDLVERKIAKIGVEPENMSGHRYSNSDIEELQRAQAWANLPDYLRFGEGLTDEQFASFKARALIDVFES